MKYIKTYELFTPIKVNNAKPFKVKKNLNKSMLVLRDSIASLRRRLQDEKSLKKRSEMNRDINIKIHKLAELNFKNLKQIEYFRNNPITEELESEDYSEDLVSILESPDFQPEDIEKYMGFDKNEYEIDTDYDYDKHTYGPKYDKTGINFFIDTKNFEDLLAVEEGIIRHLFTITSSYGGYEYYVDDSELDYLHRFLPDETLKNIKKLADLFDYELDIESDDNGENREIRDFFEYLGLKDKLDNFISEISTAHEEVVENSARELLKSLPFEIFWNSGKFDLEIKIDYDTIIEYMKKHEIKVKTIKEFLENLYEASDFTYEFEYDTYGDVDYTDLVKEVDNVVDDYLSSPDDIFPKLIVIDNIELFKKKLDLANFKYYYDIWFDFNRKNSNLFEIAKFYNKEILKWFMTYEFQEKIIDNDAEIYKLLKESDIINPEIEKEFAYLIDSERYNL